jgi:hypothetical protein
MNAERRRKIKYVLDDIDNVIVALTEIRDEEQSSLDNMPENLAFSDKYSEMEDNIQALDNAIEALDEVVFSITNDVI